MHVHAPLISASKPFNFYEEFNILLPLFPTGSLFCPFLTSFCICRYLFLPLSPLLIVCRKWNREEGRLYQSVDVREVWRGADRNGRRDGGVCSESDMCSVWPMTGQARCDSSRHDLTLSFPVPTVPTWTYSHTHMHTHLSILWGHCGFAQSINLD